MKLEINRHNANILRMAEAHPELLVLSADLGSSCEVKEFKIGRASCRERV